MEENKVNKAFEKLFEWSGWHGRGENKDIYYCEHCGQSHEDNRLINHSVDCAFKITLDYHTAALQSAAQPAQGGDWQPAYIETPKGLHTNPDARAWAAYFAQVFPGQKHMEDLMHSWFANAMMAMYDHLGSKERALTGHGGEKTLNVKQLGIAEDPMMDYQRGLLRGEVPNPKKLKAEDDGVSYDE